MHTLTKCWPPPGDYLPNLHTDFSLVSHIVHDIIVHVFLLWQNRGRFCRGAHSGLTLAWASAWPCTSHYTYGPNTSTPDHPSCGTWTSAPPSRSACGGWVPHTGYQSGHPNLLADFKGKGPDAGLLAGDRAGCVLRDGAPR